MQIAGDTHAPVPLELSLIRINGGTQPRTAISPEIAADYAVEMQAGALFPPVDVFYDGEAYWLADGFHRVLAAKGAQLGKIAATIHQGTRRDAVLFSVGANAAHGQPRTDEDKRMAVSTLLRDAEWVKWSDTVIAKACRVSITFVGNIRKKTIHTIHVDSMEERVFIHPKTGKESTMDTTNIGKKSQPKKRRPGGNIYRDGKLIAVETDREVEEHFNLARGVIEAVEALGTIRITPEEYIRIVAPYDYDMLDTHVPSAIGWLTALQDAWRKHRGKDS